MLARARTTTLRVALVAAIVAGGLAVTVPVATAALPPDLLVTVVTPQYVYNVSSVPSGAGQVTRFLGNATDLAVSRDGTQMVYRQESATSQAWVLADAAGRVVRPLFTTEPGDCVTPDWSPDGTRLLFSCGVVYPFGDQVYPALTVVDVATGTSKRILPSGRYSDMIARWSPRGDLIAFTRAGGPPPYSTFGLDRSRVMLVRPDGTGLTVLAAAATLSEHAAAFSPDGLSVAFVTRAFEPQNVPFTQEDLAVARISDGRTTRISSPAPSGAARYFFSPAYSPDGSTVAALETANWQVYPIVSRVALVPSAGGATTYAAGGAQLAGLGLTWRAPRSAVSGTTPAPAPRSVPVTASTRVVTAPSGVADGQLAYTFLGGVTVAPSPGAPSVTLTPTKFPYGLVARADGTKFLYERNVPGDQNRWEIREERASGGGGVTIYTSTQQCSPRARPDASTVAVECLDPFANLRTWGTVTTPGGVLHVIYQAALYPTNGWRDVNPTWSPDGATIAFTRYKADQSAPRVMLMNADGTGIRPATTAVVTADSGDQQPAWTPAGDLVLVTSRFATLDPLYHEDLALTRPGTAALLRLTSTASVSNVRYLEGPSVAPSGTRVLVHERTSILGDGDGRSHPVLVSLTPASLNGAAVSQLLPQALPPAVFLTAWARATA